MLLQVYAHFVSSPLVHYHKVELNYRTVLYCHMCVWISIHL